LNQLTIIKHFMQTSDPDIFVVDAHYYQNELASIHLLRDGDRFAIIDTGTNDSVKYIEAALKELGASFAHVDHIILTHIHLDHAGGAGALMGLCKNAGLIVHPRGARHMVDPSKLVAGATAVYGEDEFAKMYGNIIGIDESRVTSPADGEQLQFGSKTLTFYDTPGHASHHFCIVDEGSKSIFTGDTLGIGYKALRDENHTFLCPTTTPVQFDPAALHASIDRIMALEPARLYLTHYSEVIPTTRMIAGLHEQIDDYVALTERAMNDGKEESLGQIIEDYLVTRATNELPDLDESVARDWLKLDANLNAQGLSFWWQHKRA